MAYFGVCYSPYHRSSAHPPYTVSADDVDADMALMKKAGVTHIRTYSTTSGNEHNVFRAAKYGLKVGLGIWIEAKDDFNPGFVDGAINQILEANGMFPGEMVVDFVIGNEVDRNDGKGNLSPSVILQYIAYAKQQLAAHSVLKNIRVTCCFSGTVLQSGSSPWTSVIDACTGPVYLTVYPWYATGAGAPQPNNITGNMNWSWDNGLKQVVARGKTIVIAEIGWPSAGGDSQHSPTTVQNEQINYQTTKKFLSGQTAPHWNIDTYWFEMFDEAWKTAEGPWGPHWGLYTSGPNPTPKFNF